MTTSRGHLSLIEKLLGSAPSIAGDGSKSQAVVGGFMPRVADYLGG